VGPPNQLPALRQQWTRKIRMVTRTKATNQRAKTRAEDVEDVGDTVVDTVYLKEGKAAEESVTRSHLTKMTIPRT
jgi:hypothetical protein